MPEFAAPTPRPPARGLDLAALAVTALEGTAAPPPPEVPGYEITALLGTGGLGHVWKATRLADGTTVALKIPHAADPGFAERLHGEAESLRALDHPHILRCLSHGTLPDGHPWLALEYIHGAPLSVLIPPGGFAWEEALTHFRRLAAAVIHAHEKGVLHRDLKPSNILIGHDGSLKVADFGLARPLAERVVSFSLTLSGHVAGTAEYLAPECYARDYRPAAAADIYALGVILYELLSGHPPRGAWTPVSQQKQVDIRVDDVIRRALEPDPAKRFPSVQAMLAELEVIARTPPRYAGTPRLTRAVRFMDFVWTALGLFVFFGALGLVVRIEKYGFGLPVDLIGTGTMRIGTYQAVAVLLAVFLPMGVWQLLRLWRFRRVPLREALPAPFGLKLGTTRTAATAVLLAQIFLVIAPGLMAARSWRSQCSHWLKEGDAPWMQGLVISEGYRGGVAHDPWAWPEPGKEYSLRERSGWITDPLSTQHDHTDFIPGLIPRLIAGMAIFYAATLVLTILSALLTWQRFRKWGRSIMLMGTVVLSIRALRAEARLYDEERRKKTEGLDVPAYYVAAHARRACETVRHYLFPPDGPPQWESPPAELLAHYAPLADMGDGIPSPRSVVISALTEHAARSRRLHRTLTYKKGDVGPDPSGNPDRFFYEAYLEDFTDRPGADASGGLTILLLQGNLLPGTGAEITRQSSPGITLWSVPRRPLLPEEATAWAAALLAALEPDRAASDPAALNALFYPRMLRFGGPGPDPTAATRDVLLDPLRAIIAGGSRPRLLRPPGRAQELPGARRRILLEIEDHGQPATWNADLIHDEGRWQCVKLTF